MTVITYKCISGFGECRAIIGEGAEVVRIIVEGIDGGIISVGTLSARLRRGAARINLSALPDGEYSPILYTNDGKIQLERIRKEGKKLTRPPVDTDLVARLLYRVEALESEVAELKGRTDKNELAISGHSIFG